MSIEALLNTLQERLKPFESENNGIDEIQDELIDKISAFEYMDNIKYIISIPEDHLESFKDSQIYTETNPDDIRNIKDEVLNLKEEIREIQKTDPNFENQSNLEDLGIKCFKLRKVCMEASSALIYKIFKQHNFTAESFIEELRTILDNNKEPEIIDLTDNNE
jgi:hypothetical protein